MNINPFKHVADFVDDYCHGALSGDDAHLVRVHCQECDECAAALAEAEERYALLKSIPGEKLTTDMADAVLKTVTTRAQAFTRFRQWYTRLVVVAAVVAVMVCGGFHVYFYNVYPTPYDLRIVGQTDWGIGSDASLRVNVFSEEGGPLKGNVPVKLWLTAYGHSEEDGPVPEPTVIAEFETDEKGFASPTFKVPDWAPGKYQLHVIATPDGWREDITADVTLTRQWRLMLSTDKPVYQPGQTIHMRSLTLSRETTKPAGGQEATFTLSDPKGNVLFKEFVPTGQFGIASVDCPLAGEIDPGDYKIACTVDDTTSERTVQVMKYVLPKFKIDVTTNESYYLPGNKVEGDVSVRYFFGEAVADAQVAVEVWTTGFAQRRLLEETLTTDADGKSKRVLGLSRMRA